MRDLKAIPALAGALGTGMRVVRALTAFGDAAALAVLQIVRSPASSKEAVDDGLVALRLMVEARERDR